MTETCDKKIRIVTINISLSPAGNDGSVSTHNEIENDENTIESRRNLHTRLLIIFSYFSRFIFCLNKIVYLFR